MLSFSFARLDSCASACMRVIIPVFLRQLSVENFTIWGDSKRTPVPDFVIIPCGMISIYSVYISIYIGTVSPNSSSEQGEGSELNLPNIIFRPPTLSIGCRIT